MFCASEVAGLSGAEQNEGMKKALLLALALIAIPPIALEAQDPFTLTVSEFMAMEDAERYAFNGYVIGLYQM